MPAFLKKIKLVKRPFIVSLLAAAGLTLAPAGCGPPPPAEIGPAAASSAAGGGERGEEAETSSPEGASAAAEGEAPSEVQVVPKVILKPAAEEAASAAEEAGGAIGEEGFDNEGFAYPETHFCIKEREVLVYYLYEPGSHEGWLCELRFSHIPAYWYATTERSFCSQKLFAHLKRAKGQGFSCYCSRPGKPAKTAQITDSGYACDESEGAEQAALDAKAAAEAAVKAAPRPQTGEGAAAEEAEGEDGNPLHSP